MTLAPRDLVDSTRREPALDGVRGLAILIVFVHHVAIFSGLEGHDGIARWLLAGAGFLNVGVVLLAFVFLPQALLPEADTMMSAFRHTLIAVGGASLIGALLALPGQHWIRAPFDSKPCVRWGRTATGSASLTVAFVTFHVVEQPFLRLKRYLPYRDPPGARGRVVRRALDEEG